MDAMFHRPEATIDMAFHLRLQAEQLARLAPPPAWRSVVRNPEIDAAVLLPNGLLLAALTELSAGAVRSAVFPSYGPYVLFDTQSGRELWRSPREPDYQYSYAVLATTPVILVQRTGSKTISYTALDLASGARRWTTTGGASGASLVDLDSGTFVFVRDPAGGVIEAVSLEHGTPLWKETGRPITLGQGPVLRSFDEQLLVAGADLVCRSIRDGRINWAVADTGPPSVAGVRRLPNGAILAPAASGRVSLIQTNGVLVWQAQLAGTAKDLVVADDKLVFEVESTGSTNAHLAAVTLAGGQKLWERPLEGNAYSPLRWDGSNLLFTQRNTLEWWDAATGQTRRSVTFPAGPLYRLPDEVRLQSSQVVVAMEMAVGAFHQEDGRLLWWHKLKGVDATLYHSAQFKLWLAEGELEPAKPAATPARPSGSSSGPIFSEDVVWSGVRTAIRQRDQVYQSTESHRRSGSPAERGYAVSARRLANEKVRLHTEMAISFDRANTAIEMFFTTVQMKDLGMAVGGVIRDRAYAKAEVARLGGRLRHALELHYGALQGEYFLRPFEAKRGGGVLVIDLKNGAWCELPTAPSEEHLKEEVFVNTRPVVLTGDGNRLVTKGTGLDPSKWETDKRFLFAATVHKSLLAYDLSQLAFKSPDTYATQSLAAEK